MKSLYEYICENDPYLKYSTDVIFEGEDNEDEDSYDFDDESHETEPEGDLEEDDSDDKDVETIDINGFVVLKPGFVEKEGELRSRLEDIDWEIVGEASKKLTEDEAKEFYSTKKNEPYFEDLIEYMTSDESKCFMLWKKEAAKPIEEIRTFKEKIRAEWAEDELKNALHSSDSFDDMERELAIYLEEPEEDEPEEDEEDENDDDDYEDYDDFDDEDEEDDDEHEDDDHEDSK